MAKRAVKTERGGTLYPQAKGEPAPPGAGRPKNPFREAIRIASEASKPVQLTGLLVVDGVVTDRKATISIVLPGADAIVEKAMRQARKGDAQARKWLTETGWGKALNLGSDDENPLPLTGFRFVVENAAHEPTD